MIYIYIYTYFELFIYIYILWHIVLYSTWYIQLISYSDLCTTSPSTTHVPELIPTVSTIFYGGNESKIQKRRSDSEAGYILELFHMSMMFHWYLFDPFLRNPLFVWPVGHFWTSIKGIPSPGAWGVLRKPGYRHESHWLSWRLGDLVNSSLATGHNRTPPTDLTGRTIVFRCFLECSTVFIAIKGGLKSQ